MNYLSKYIETENIAYVWLDICDHLDLIFEKSINELKSLDQNIEENDLNLEDQNALKRKKQQTSFIWKNINRDKTKVTRLYQVLKKHNFIDVDTKPDVFKAIFEGEAKGTVKWIGEGGLTEILYLFFNLWGDKEDSVKYVEKPNRQYKILENCFTWNSDTVKTNSLKSIYSEIKNDRHYPSRAKDIDRIIESLK